MVTIKYNNVYVNNWFTICGSDEANGNIKNVNMVLKDKYYGEKTLEDAEIKMQKTVINNLRRFIKSTWMYELYIKKQ